MLKLLLSAVLATLLGGCANVGYYTQAVSGHLELLFSARSIPQILDDPRTTPSLREQLRQATAIREFASQELALPDNGSYRSYADLGRPYVVWNVFAAKEFSTELEEWCMIFVGCVNYRGYYSQEAAERFAQELRERGLDTYVASIPAYSTLGFFDDPVLNTFLRFGEQEVARMVFHELAHHLVFIPGDSTFNESFATAVENEGMRRWLAHTGDTGQQKNFEGRQRRKEQFQNLVAEFRDKLKNLYAQPGSSEDKRRTKQAILAELRQSYAVLKESWGGRSGYDAFFDQNLNNATLGSVSLYTKLVPAFEALLEQVDDDLPAFYRRVKSLSKLSKPERRATLSQLQKTVSNY